MRIVATFGLLALAACSGLPQNAPVPAAKPIDWRSVVTEGDQERLRDWRKAFVRALEQARASGHQQQIAAEGPLLQPDAAIGPVPITNGDYRCRVIKVGAKSAGMLDYVAYPAFACRIAQQGTVQSFTKLSGSQRHVGIIYPADALRQAFLGTLVLGDERNAMRYGHDLDRDVAGWVERIGDNRWRLILPYPRYESTLDVIELVPAR